MATTKKAAKKKAAKKSPGGTIHTWTINADLTFDPDPLDEIEDGDLIQVDLPPDVCFDIKVKIKKAKCAGAGGGVTIHS